MALSIEHVAFWLSDTHDTAVSWPTVIQKYI